jgi:hypothetical protein
VLRGKAKGDGYAIGFGDCLGTVRRHLKTLTQGIEMAKAFASQGDLADKSISFTEIGEGLYAFTAEGDPNSGVIIGDDS